MKKIKTLIAVSIIATLVIAACTAPETKVEIVAKDTILVSPTVDSIIVLDTLHK